MEIRRAKQLAGEEKIDVCLQQLLHEGFIDSYRRVDSKDSIDREIDAWGIDFYIYKGNKKKYPVVVLQAKSSKRGMEKFVKHSRQKGWENRRHIPVVYARQNDSLYRIEKILRKRIRGFRVSLAFIVPVRLVNIIYQRLRVGE
ncbi:hypothetical protein KGQ34_00775 [Patescibacteria group bacterium]|nr:hypothetical protein [Patescibacteria group bacterium]